MAAPQPPACATASNHAQPPSAVEATASDLHSGGGDGGGGTRGAQLCGDAASDGALLEAARLADLTDLTVSSAPHITGDGVARAVLESPNLTRLSLSDLGPSAHAACGCFLPRVLELRYLQALELKFGAQRESSRTDGDAPAATQERPAADWPASRSLTHLALGGAAPCDALLRRCPELRALELDGTHGAFASSTTAAPRSIETLAESCALVAEVHLTVDRHDVLGECVAALRALPRLSTLAVTVGGFAIDAPQMAALGAMPLADLRLFSQDYPKLSGRLRRHASSHVDNVGVTALVDAVCERSTQESAAQPLKLSICGATQLTYIAVEALLRLPSLLKLNIAGCNRIAARDKMRLIAKIKAGREQQGLPSGGGDSATSATAAEGGER